MKQYRYILLDWDGNLAKTLDLWLEETRACLATHGLRLSDEEIAASFGAFQRCFAEWGIADVHAAIDEIVANVKKRLPNVELYPDALEVLAALHAQGKKLALITTSHHDYVQHLLEKHDIASYFDAIVAGDDVTHHKPHPEPIEKALTLLHGTKGEAVMIGDTEKDIDAASNAGVDSILFYPPEHQRFYSLEKLKAHNPTHTVGDFRQILQLV